VQCGCVHLHTHTSFCVFVQLAVNSVCASEQPTYETCHSTTEKRETSLALQSPLLGILLGYLFPFRNTRLSMYWGSRRELNGTSRQPTSCQSRRPEAADDAGIARKRRATVLMVVQCRYALTRMRPGNGHTPPSALPGLCRRDVR